jgi:hypothetical protein
VAIYLKICLKKIKISSLPTNLFCDGHPDCTDSSDEGWCDPEHDPNAAPSCEYANCTLPNCFCSVDGTLIPGKKASPWSKS